MKWGIFKKKKTLSDELKQRNKSLEEEKLGDTRFAQPKKSFFRRSAEAFKSFFKEVKLDEDLKEQIEDFLLSLDFGPFLAQKVSEQLAIKISKENLSHEDLQRVLKEELINLYGPTDTSLNIEKGRMNFLLMIGANGSGKTTSIAKLAYHFKEQDFNVAIIAGDTFRAGAVEQLQQWAKRVGVDIFVPQKPKEDPSALIYRFFQNESQKTYDLVICDTSGKQHNNQNLLQELNKVCKTIQRFDSTSPHESLLVIDSTIGQISLLQAENFTEYAGVTGIILTKMDRMTRGGIIFSIKEKLKIPVKLVGTGESLDDLDEFNIEELVEEWTSILSS